MTHSPENRRRFSAPTFGAEIWTVCHGLKRCCIWYSDDGNGHPTTRLGPS